MALQRRYIQLEGLRRDSEYRDDRYLLACWNYIVSFSFEPSSGT